MINDTNNIVKGWGLSRKGGIMDIEIGDDITVAGKVISVRENHFIDTTEILVQTNREHVHWFTISEIKTHRPINNSEEDDLK